MKILLMKAEYTKKSFIIKLSFGRKDEPVTPISTMLEKFFSLLIITKCTKFKHQLKIGMRAVNIRYITL